MRYIEKGPEPDGFRQWKALASPDWQPTWDGFQKPEKLEVHNALLDEQGRACCYCGSEILLKDSHVEHLRPRSMDQLLTLEYSNLLASCQGERNDAESRPVPVHCGHKKGIHLLPVTPLMWNCQDHFRFTSGGEILPTLTLDSAYAASQTIAILGLDIDKLTALRRSALEPLLDGIDMLDSTEIRRLRDGFARRNEHGCFEPFAATIVYVLERYL